MESWIHDDEGVAYLPPPQVAFPQPTVDPDLVEGFLRDASRQPGGFAQGVVRPRDASELAAIVAHTRRTGTPLLAIGAQSSLTGGGMPHGELIVSTRDLSSIQGLRVDSARVARVTAGAGVSLADLQEYVGRAGWFYPPVPTYNQARLGGTLATNAAGSATFKYGSTRPWVERLKVVLDSGWTLDIPRGARKARPGERIRLAIPGQDPLLIPVPTYRLPVVKKCSMGYHTADPLDLVDLFVGAEGTLGIVVEATVGLVPAPPQVLGAMLHLDDEREAVQLVAKLRHESERTWRERDRTGIDVRAIEHLDEASLDLLRRHGVIERLRLPVPDTARICLLVEIELGEGFTDLEIQAQLEKVVAGRGADPANGLERLLGFLRDNDVLDRLELVFPDDPRSLDRFHRMREAVPAQVNELVARNQSLIHPEIAKLAGDMCVPFEHFQELLDRHRAEFDRRGLDFVVFGHISDGNVHPNVIARSREEMTAGKEALIAVADWVQSIGGSLMAEHGVGRNPLKKELLARYFGADGIDQMRRLRRALVPDERLAPGVLFS